VVRRDFPISLSVAGWEANIRVFLSFYASTCHFYSFTMARRKLKERVLPETLWDDFEEEKKRNRFISTVLSVSEPTGGNGPLSRRPCHGKVTSCDVVGS